VDSDHHLLEVWIKRKRGRGERVEMERVYEMSRDKKNSRKNEKYNIRRGWEKFGERGNGEEVERGEVKKELSGTNEKRGGWWDKECKEKKREVRRKLRE